MSAQPKVIEYATAVDRGLKIMARHGKDSWQLGDIAANVETKYGKDTHQNLARDIGINYKTLINYRTVARAYAPAERSKVNSFRVHEIFASLDSRAALVAEKEWTAAEAQAKLAEIKAGQVPPENSDGEGTGSKEPDMSPIDAARARVAKLEAELVKARAKLAALEAEDAKNNPPAPVQPLRPVPNRAGSPRRTRHARQTA